MRTLDRGSSERLRPQRGPSSTSERSPTRVPGTLETYTYAVQHFIAFLEGSRNAGALSIAGPNAAERVLGGQAQDVILLAWLVNHLGQEVERAHADRSATRSGERRLEPATVRLFAQAVIARE